MATKIICSIPALVATLYLIRKCEVVEYEWGVPQWAIDTRGQSVQNTLDPSE